MASPEQTIAPPDGVWPWVGRILEDILAREVPGSVVLLIVALCLTPYVAFFARRWLKRRS